MLTAMRLFGWRSSSAPVIIKKYLSSRVSSSLLKENRRILVNSARNLRVQTKRPSRKTHKKTFDTKIFVWGALSLLWVTGCVVGFVFSKITLLVDETRASLARVERNIRQNQRELLEGLPENNGIFAYIFSTRFIVCFMLLYYILRRL